MGLPFSQELTALKDYFSTAALPAGPISMDGYGTINDSGLFVKTSLTVAEQDPGNKWHEGALIRLQWMRDYIEKTEK